MRWPTKVLRKGSASVGRWRISFRWVLPAAQLVVCVVVLWPLNAELISQTRTSFEAYWPGSEPEQPWHFRPANLSEEQSKQEETEELRLYTSISLNLPVVSFASVPEWIRGDAYSPPWAPRGMDFKIWWAMSSPIVGILPWWVVGRGLDALLAARRRLAFPRLRKIELALATFWIAPGVWWTVVAVQDFEVPGNGYFWVFGIGGALWTLLGSATILAWFSQWRTARTAVLDEAR